MGEEANAETTVAGRSPICGAIHKAACALNAEAHDTSAEVIGRAE